MRVLNAGVEAEPSGRRMTVRGVAREKNAADPIALRQHAFHRPFGHAPHFHRQVGDAEDLANLFGRRLIAERRRVERHAGKAERPFRRIASPFARPHRYDDRNALAMHRLQPVEQHPIIGNPLRQIGLEMNANLGDELGRALHGDAQHPADRAAAVGGDEVFRPNGLRLLGVDVTDRRGDAVGVLGEFNQFAREADARRPAFLRVRLDERLKANLRQVGGVGRRRLQIVNDPRRTLAAERAHLEDRLAGERVVAAQRGIPFGLRSIVRRRALGIDVVGEPVLAEDLHGPLVEIVRLGKDRCRGVTLDGQKVDALVGEEDRGREAATAASDNENIDGPVDSWRPWFPPAVVAGYRCAALHKCGLSGGSKLSVSRENTRARRVWLGRSRRPASMISSGARRMFLRSARRKTIGAGPRAVIDREYVLARPTVRRSCSLPSRAGLAPRRRGGGLCRGHGTDILLPSRGPTAPSFCIAYQPARCARTPGQASGGPAPKAIRVGIEKSARLSIKAEGGGEVTPIPEQHPATARLHRQSQ